MKTIKAIVVIVLLILTGLSGCVPAPVPAQTFKGRVEVGQGFKFKDYKNPQWYMLTTSIKPSAGFFDDKLQLSIPVLVMYSDGITDYYTGTEASVKVYEKNKFNIQLLGSALMGTKSKRIYGGGPRVEYDTWYVSINVRQENENKHFLFDGAIGKIIF